MTESSIAAAEQNDQPSGQTGRKPADKFREGPVHVSIWEKEGPKGAFRTASFEIRYRKDDQWQSSHSYGATDLKHLETAANEARARIEQWQKGNKASQDNVPL